MRKLSIPEYAKQSGITYHAVKIRATRKFNPIKIDWDERTRTYYIDADKYPPIAMQKRGRKTLQYILENP